MKAETVAQRNQIRNKISALQARLKAKMEVNHLNKIIEDQAKKISGFKDMFRKHLKDEPKIVWKFNKDIEDNYEEYDSDNSFDQWFYLDKGSTNKR